MSPTNLTAQLHQFGVVPVVQITQLNQVLPLAEVLTQNQLPVIEITLRSDVALEAIALVAREFPTLSLGAGTVLSVDQLQRAIDAGAHFIVTPGTNLDVVSKAFELGTPIIPGAVTPSEVELLLSHHINLMKFFPAEAAGGPSYIKALSGPYPNAQFMPTGGVSEANLPSYLALSSVAACGGTWIASSELLKQANFEQIQKNVASVVALVADLRKDG